jgi:hypothetical protein
MKRILAVIFLAAIAKPAYAAQRPLIYDAVALNIGVNCSWEGRCMSSQRRAMKAALTYVARQHPPHWRVQMCNRNAARGGARVDWIGFDHCIRNASLRPAPVRHVKKRRH